MIGTAYDIRDAVKAVAIQGAVVVRPSTVVCGGAAS